MVILNLIDGYGQPNRGDMIFSIFIAASFLQCILFQ